MCLSIVYLLAVCPQGMYFVSSVLLMRMNVPEDYRYVRLLVRV